MFSLQLEISENQIEKNSELANNTEQPEFLTNYMTLT